MKKARYIRVSTQNQNIERQERDNENEIIFIDKISGSIPFNKRPKGKRLIDEVLKSNIDYVIVHAIDRLGRSLVDILSTLEFFQNHNVIVKVESLGLESMVNNKPNPSFNLIISVMANVAEMERNTMLERQKEGVAIAKAKGNYKGRLKGSKESNKVFLSKYPSVQKNLKEGISVRKTAKLNDVSESTVKKVKRMLKSQ